MIHDTKGSLQKKKPEIEFDVMEEMYAASCMCMWRKDDLFRQRRLSIHHVLCIVHYKSCIILMHHALVSCIKNSPPPPKKIVLKTTCPY